MVVGPWSSLGADLGSGDCEEAFSSFRYWRDPLPEVPVLAPAKPDKLGKEAHRDLDRYFATRSYCVGYQPSALDQEVLELLEASPRGGGDLETLPHLARFVRHARSFPKSPSGSDGGSREEEVVRKLIVMGKVPTTYYHMFIATSRTLLVWREDVFFSRSVSWFSAR